MCFIIVGMCQMTIWCLSSAENIQTDLNRYRFHPLRISCLNKNTETNIKMRIETSVQISNISIKLFCIKKYFLKYLSSCYTRPETVKFCPFLDMDLDSIDLIDKREGNFIEFLCSKHYTKDFLTCIILFKYYNISMR